MSELPRYGPRPRRSWTRRRPSSLGRRPVYPSVCCEISSPRERLAAAAFKFFGSFHGANARGWLLTIVRNTCYTWFRENRAEELTTSFNEGIHSTEADPFDPQKLLLQRESSQLLKQALEELPLEFREVLVLRELEGLSYKEIAGLCGIPVGTVMSRLARARQRLEQYFTGSVNKEPCRELPGK